MYLVVYLVVVKQSGEEKIFKVSGGVKMAIRGTSEKELHD